MGMVIACEPIHECDGHGETVPSCRIRARPGRSGAGFLDALAGPVRDHVGPAGAPVRAVPPGTAGRRIDEYPGTRCRLADAEPVDAELGEPDREAHRRAGGVLVG